MAIPTQQYLQEARLFLSHIQAKIRLSLKALQQSQIKREEEMMAFDGGDKRVARVLYAYNEKRMNELSVLHPSPYFMRLDIEHIKGKQTLHIGKGSIPEEGIISWISPLARIRYADPGAYDFLTQQGEKKKGTLLRKDQYMIVDGKILFFDTQAIDQERTLIYQEHFSNRKKAFMLKDVVAQLEEAQDRVIRMGYKGPMLISGPAGSGKTTLALHRIAYVMQSPETTDVFPGHKIRVLVQDEGSVAYFSQLLPSLGISNVSLHTFRSWALDVLGLEDMQPVETMFSSLQETEQYRLQKLQALHDKSKEVIFKNMWQYLSDCYASYFDRKEKDAWQRQKDKKMLDDIDLTMLLLFEQRKEGRLLETKEYFVQQKNNEVIRKKGRFPVAYRLLLLDEFQNYLPEQIQLLRSCLDTETNAVIYIGDMAQQIRFGSIQSWEECGEEIREKRQIHIGQVYRNTKAILRYMHIQGYSVDIPDSLPEGKSVNEYRVDSFDDINIQLKDIITHKEENEQIGIIVYDEEQAEALQAYEDDEKQVYVKSIHRAQGLEFTHVVFIDVLKKEDEHQGYCREKGQEKQYKKIRSDMRYIALSRAIEQLTVIKIHKY